MSIAPFLIETSNAEAGDGDAGNTGSWRVERPVINMALCTPAKRQKAACHLCWLFCPDGVVTKDLEPEIRLEYCKGCGICAEECPTNAIDMVAESEFIKD